MKSSKPGNIYSGTSGLVVPEANKSAFPLAFRDKSRLTYYAFLFNSIEVNSSFKKLPMSRTVAKWAAEVSTDFKFTFKCPQAITHNKDLAFIDEDVHQFLQVIDNVGNKKGCVLLQFPGRLPVEQITQLEKLLKSIQAYDPDNQWKIALEFRNTSWYHPEVYHLLEIYHACLVLHDLASSAPPVTDSKAPLTYIRFHGPEKGYKGSYAEDFLSSYARRIQAWKTAGKQVYTYFNNTLGSAAQNLSTLNRFIEDLER